MSKDAKVPKLYKRGSLLAIADMEKLGINPVQMLHTAYLEAMKGYFESRNKPYNSDPGPAYLSAAISAAGKLAGFKHPTLSAIAVKEVESNDSAKAPLTTREAVQVIESDPFKKALDSSDVVEKIGDTGPTSLIRGEGNK